MKNIAIVILLLFSMPAFSQHIENEQTQKDSINNEIKQELKLSQSGMDSVLAVLQWSSVSIEKIAGSALQKEQKIEQIKAIAAQRDQKIKTLLTEAQIIKLKGIMSSYKEKMKTNRNNKAKSAGKS